MGIEKAIFNRSRLLLGDENMRRIEDAKVIIFGVGGVGSWCAESLVRTGIRHLTVVDSDCVCITNINRQLMATTATVGEVKVVALKKRLLEINPEADIRAIQAIYDERSAPSFNLDEYDYVIDCIDSLKDKALLILNATGSRATLFSSMGAALKVDPTRIRVAEFWKVDGCPLGRLLRKRFKRNKTFPAKKFKCVFSNEVLENLGEETNCGSSRCVCPKMDIVKGNPELANHEWCSSKAQINGSLMHITAIFGLTIAGLVIEDIIGSPR